MSYLQDTCYHNDLGEADVLALNPAAKGFSAENYDVKVEGF